MINGAWASLGCNSESFSFALRSQSRCRRHDANPPGKPLALSHRLAATVRCDPVRARRIALREEQAPSPAPRRSPRRWPLVVGCRGWILALRPWMPYLGKRLHPRLAAFNIRGTGLRPFRSRPGQQRSCEPSRTMSALPHDPGCGRASLGAVVERLQAASASRFVRRSAHHARADHATSVVKVAHFHRGREIGKDAPYSHVVKCDDLCVTSNVQTCFHQAQIVGPSGMAH